MHTLFPTELCLPLFIQAFFRLHGWNFAGIIYILLKERVTAQLWASNTSASLRGQIFSGCSMGCVDTSGGGCDTCLKCISFSSLTPEFWQWSRMLATRPCESSQCPHVSFPSIKAICVEIKAVSPLLLLAHPSLTWFGST